MDLARVRRMLGMALILVVTFLLLSFLVVRNSSPQDTNNYYKAFARNKGVKIETHNIITQKVLYSWIKTSLIRVGSPSIILNVAFACSALIVTGSVFNLCHCTGGGRREGIPEVVNFRLFWPDTEILWSCKQSRLGNESTYPRTLSIIAFFQTQYHICMCLAIVFVSVWQLYLYACVFVCVLLSVLVKGFLFAYLCQIDLCTTKLYLICFLLHTRWLLGKDVKMKREIPAADVMASLWYASCSVCEWVSALSDRRNRIAPGTNPPLTRWDNPPLWRHDSVPLWSAPRTLCPPDSVDGTTVLSE